jgi:hypothetical protein
MRWLSRFIEHVRVAEPDADGVMESQRLPGGRTLLNVRVHDSGGDVTVSGAANAGTVQAQDGNDEGS